MTGSLFTASQQEHSAATLALPAREAEDRPHRRHRGIDGWRGIAAGLVVFSHACDYRFGQATGLVAHYAQRLAGPLAEIGVQLFFVISGFIITSLLLREQSERGVVSIRAFYARRVCRIMPPLAVYYAALMLLAAMRAIALPRASLLSSATFTCNTGIVECDWWVAHTWSLAVEEQFYLGWPLLFAALAARARPRLLLAVLAVCAVVTVLQKPTFHANATSFACIAAGALYATSGRVRQACRRYTHGGVLLAAVLLVTLGPLTRAAPFVTVALPVLITYIVFAGNAIGRVRKVLESAPLQLIGAGSYSLYLWQQLFLAQPPRYAAGAPSLLLLPLVVFASVRLVEQPFIRLGRRLSRGAERAGMREAG